MLSVYFEKLGFTNNEALVYLALAQLGKSTASIISKRNSIPRTTAYSVLDSLAKKGLVSVEHKKGSTFYTVNRASALLRSVEKEKQEVAERELVATELVKLVEPYFKGTNFSIPKLQFYEGRNSVEALLYDRSVDFRESARKYDFSWWGYQDHTFVEHYLEWLQYYWREVKVPEEEVKLLSNEVVIEKGLRGKVPGREIRSISSAYNFSSTIWIVGDFIVLVMTQQEPHYAFIMNDAVFSANLRLVFRLLWDTH